jgi:hypothetical protein
MSDRDDALEEAAKFAEFYAEERMRQAEDTIFLDPVLSGASRTRADFEKAKDLMVEGCIHSAAYHAAMHIAEHLRSLKSRKDPTP